MPRDGCQAPERLAQCATLNDQAPERLAQRAASSSSSPEKSITTSEDARAVRDRQLRDLLSTLGMRGRLTSSSSSATKGVRYDGNPSSESAVAHVVAGQTKPVMLPRNFDDSIHASQLMRLPKQWIHGRWMRTTLWQQMLLLNRTVRRHLPARNSHLHDLNLLNVPRDEERVTTMRASLPILLRSYRR